MADDSTQGITIRHEPDDGEEVPAPEPPIEPGRPAAENVLFVVLGILGALAVILRLVQLLG